MRDPSIYDDRQIQIHDTGINERMVKFSGDPSSLVPPSMDASKPVPPVVDITRYQEESFICYIQSTGGSASASFTLLNLQSEANRRFNSARAWQLESVQWTESFNGTAWDGWYELDANMYASDGTLVNVPLMAYFATLAGPNRSVKIIVPKEQMNTARFDKPIFQMAQSGHALSPYSSLNSLIFRWDRTLGSGLPAVTAFTANFKLFF